MNDETSQLLLEEFRSFRSDISDWRGETSERLTAIETAIKPAILGNGQPSRLTSVEARCTALEVVRWRGSGMMAVAAAIAAVVSTVVVDVIAGMIQHGGAR